MMLTTMLALLAVGGWTAIPAQPTGAQAPQMTQAMTQAKPMEQAKPMSGSAFLKTAAQANLSEIALAKLAQQKSTRDDVKAYAAMLQADHERCLKTVLELGDEMMIDLPETQSEAQMATEARLGKLDGQAFDRAYLDQMVKDHTAAVALFKVEEMAEAPTVAAFAKDTLPTLEKHLTRAKALQGGDAAVRLVARRRAS